MELMGAFENRQSGPVVAQNIERCSQKVEGVEEVRLHSNGPLERLNGLCVMGMVAVKLAKQHQLLWVVRISRVPAGFRDLSRGLRIERGATSPHAGFGFTFGIAVLVVERIFPIGIGF